MASAVTWVIPIAVLGAVVGSFLNVVIFRLPRGLSVLQPRWSFCPHCHARIRPRHNVPILSWFWLRGRCHTCRAPIASIYPLIECTCVLVFILVWDALFIAGLVPAVDTPGADWSMAVAYVSLFAGLLAMSGMDIESYTIDIRVCVFIILAGVVGHGVWGIPPAVLTPAASAPTGALPPALCLVGAMMGLTWLATDVVAARLRAGPPSDPTSQPAPEADSAVRDASHADPKRDTPDTRVRETTRGRESLLAPPIGDTPETPLARDDSASSQHTGSSPLVGDERDSTYASDSTYTSTAPQIFQPLPIAALCTVVLAVIAWQMLAPDSAMFPYMAAGGQRGFVGCFLFMLMIILASMVHRASDDEVIEEIEADRKGARAMALRELALLLPALAVGLGLLVLLRRGENLHAQWRDAIDALSGLGTLAPHACGVLRAVGGCVLAAALGWSVRILGTLAFGKEAFGTGDIYIMAAIGAVAGFWAGVFGFFIAGLLALVGVLATLFRKSSRAIPFGPWLAMGAFVTLWLQGLLLERFGPAGSLLWALICGRPAGLAGG